MNTFRALHPRHHIDASIGDALFALVASVLPHRRRINKRADPIICLSVRSAFDLLLDACALEFGDEVLVSGITHPDMVRIIEMHGLVAVGIDVDSETLAPTRDALDAALTKRTRMIVMAHLFGAQVNVSDVATFARNHKLIFVEDRAQSIRAADDRGDIRADVTLFSFGFIKTATAFGGALAYVRDAELAERMLVRHNKWPVQPRFEYAGKALKCIAAICLSNRWVYGFASVRHPDLSALVRATAVTNELEFTQWMRRRPCGGLVATLKYRLRNFPEDRLRQRARVGDEIALSLPGELIRPGISTTNATHWLFPVITDAPEDLVAYLQEEGFEASKATSQTVGAVNSNLKSANCMMESIVFLPAYPEIPARERRRLIRLLAKFGARNAHAHN